MSIAVETDHVQVHLYRSMTQYALVDEGIRNVIALLWDHGVRTQYSCEDNEGSAYVLADLRSALPLLLRIMRSRTLSPASAQIRRGFRKGSYELDLAWHTNLPHRGRDEAFRRIFRFGKRCWPKPGYELELCVSNKLGFRVVARWPKNMTPAVEQLLRDVGTR